MRLVTVFTVILLVAAFSIGCARSSDPDTTPVPTIKPEQTIRPEPVILTHELEVIAKPKDTATFPDGHHSQFPRTSESYHIPIVYLDGEEIEIDRIACLDAFV